MKVIYSKENCPGCVALKKDLESRGEPFKEIMIGRDITREDFITQFPGVRTVPYVVEQE